MKKVRIGLIGVKGIGGAHLNAYAQTREIELGAVCDIDEKAARKRSQELGVDYYLDYHDLVKRDDLDAVDVCTPHYLHHPMAIAALKAGKHVFVEKPMAVTVADADDMIATAKKAKRKLAICHNARASGSSWAMKERIEQGQLGELTTVILIACGMRTQAYYNTGNWRGTWWGEGGGVLINQTIHQLELIQWLAGPVAEVTAVIDTKSHRVQTEDIAAATFKFKNGAVGIFETTLINSPAISQMAICGDLGTILMDSAGLRLGKPKMSVKKYIKGATAMWGSLEATSKEIKPRKRLGGHPYMVKDFCQAVLNNRKPFAPGEEGRQAIELVNAIILSSFTGKSVKIPVDRQEYNRLISRLRREEKARLPKWKQKPTTL